MDSAQAVQALSALAHETRLAIYRMLVERGPDGLSAGVIAERLGLPPSSLTFHVQHLHRANLITQRRLSRQIIYAADFASMNGLISFLTKNCCGQGWAACLPAVPGSDTPQNAKGGFMSATSLPVAIIGAGPVGLAAAAHLLARGEMPLVLEAGSAAGHAIRQWGHVRMFTPWRFCVDRQAAALLATRGWSHPPADDVPTGGELVTHYLEPLAAALGPYVRFNARVTAVTRQHADKVRTAGRDALPFVLRVAARDGSMRNVLARAVIDASGTWFTPNPAGADGLPAFGEAEAAERIVAGVPDLLGADRTVYVGRTTVVVGSGHSALNALIDLAGLRKEAPGTHVLWLLRKDHVEAAFGGEAADALPGRGELGLQGRALVESGAVDVVTSFRIVTIGRAPNDGLLIEGDHGGKPMRLAADRMIVATGFPA